MLESSFGLCFFLKTPRKKTNIRYIHLRITVDGIPKETSLKRTWDAERWDPKKERATGTKEDARVTNFFLNTLVTKINQYKNDLMYSERTITSQKLMDFVLGKVVSKAKLMDEFHLHNEEMLALVPKEYAKATYKRYLTTMSHVREFIFFKYNIEDIEFRELDHQFLVDFDFYLKTARNCVNNSALKYIACLQKIVNRAISKSFITADPFRMFKKRRTKTVKRPLTSRDLFTIENHIFSTQRLEMVRDVFIFQCYTGLAYIDAYQLKKEDIKIGLDDALWIMSARQKTGTVTNVPLLPKALEIIEKYKDHPVCIQRGSILPVSSNQKMNEYLKEIATVCGLDAELNTHKARRTFGSTVTLNNDVPMHVVKEMLGHSSIRQTESYAITQEKTIGREMSELKNRLQGKSKAIPANELATLHRLEQEIKAIKEKYNIKLP
jgi:integrase